MSEEEERFEATIRKSFKILSLGRRSRHPERQIFGRKRDHAKSHYSREKPHKELHQENHKPTSNSPNWWQVNEVQLGLSTHSPVMIISAKLNGKPARLLLDSGASSNFLKISFVKSFEKFDEPIDFKVNKIETKSIKLADGTIIKSNQLVSNVNTFLNGRSVKSSFIALPNLNDSYDGILGMPFLTLANPDVCWKKKLLRWRTNSLTDDKSVLHASTVHELNTLNSRSVNSIKPKIEGKRYQKFKRKEYQWRKKDILHQLSSLNFASSNFKAE